VNVPKSPLVGREREISALGEAISALRRGDGGVVHIVGEAGIGKSRLLLEARELADRARHLVLSGRATEFERDYPFAPFVDALDPCFEAGAAELLEAIGSERARELAWVFPSLAVGGGEAPQISQAERFRAYDAVRVLLEELGEQRPVVLGLDDMQWADAASIELVSHLLRRPPRGPVLLLLCYRPPHASPRLAAVLDAVQRDSARHEVSPLLELAPLSEGECEQLLGPEIEAAARERIYREGGGNPFYLEQLARTEGMDVGGVAADSDAIERGVPVAVAASITGELDELTDDARELLGAAAVVGEPFDVDVTAAVAGLDEAEALRGVDELSDADLVRPAGSAREFRFRHPIVRRAVYETAPPGWLIRAHRRAADVLRDRRTPAYERAHHVERYAGPGDLEAIDVLEEAAHAVAARAPDAAASWLESALNLIPKGRTYSERRIMLLIPMTVSLAAVGRLDEASRAARKVLELWPHGSSPDRAGVVWLAALIEMLLANQSRAESILLEGLWELQDQASSEACWLKCGLALSAYFKADWEEMRTWARRALEEGRDLPPWDRANALAALAIADFGLGEMDDARAHTDEAGEIIDRLQDEHLALRSEAIMHLGWMQYSLGFNEDAIRNLDRAIDLGRQHGRGHLMGTTYLVKAASLTWIGELDAGAAACEYAIEATLLSSDALYANWAFQTACWIEILRGDLRLAVRHGEQAVAMGASIESPLSAQSPWLLAAAWVELGELEKASALVYGPGGEPMMSPLRLYVPGSFETLTNLELRRGNLELADRWSVQALRTAEELGTGAQLAEGRRARAIYFLAEERWEEAVRYALASVAAAEAVGARVEMGRSRLVAGTALSRAGLPAEAEDHLLAAMAEFEACGARRFRDSAASELRRIGHRIHVGAQEADGNGALGLTPRQLEVAELVADGRTNREIAGQLFLTEKGVESHLRRIFDKLDLSSRAALAAIVERSHSPVQD
jgi:DNA-binding CsgD family transcriptional regulator/tetratricopeptide (TPR) repeat protein